MGLKVNADQAGELVNRNERRVRDWIAKGIEGWKLPAVKRGRDWVIDTDDLAAAAKRLHIELDRERLAQLEAQEGRTSGGILARLDALERENRALRGELQGHARRLARLEGTPGTPSGSGEQSGRGTGSAHDSDQSRLGGDYGASGRLDVSPYRSSGYGGPSAFSDSLAGLSVGVATIAGLDPLPESARGRAVWVERYGGPRASWVRDWSEVPQWRTVEDVIASVRQHSKSHRDWSPVAPDVTG